MGEEWQYSSEHTSDCQGSPEIGVLELELRRLRHGTTRYGWDYLAASIRRVRNTLSGSGVVVSGPILERSRYSPDIRILQHDN
jgi:hypothetical protein